jgi:prepilin-type N-terminal cleavage/methylation domain-containing protein
LINKHINSYKNGFTLIELLVVVAIIGILAAVGVVAYNGYTTSAKNAAIKSQFNMIVKYFNAEIQKCNLGEEKIFNEQIYCSQKYTQMPWGRDIEYALKSTFTRIGYVDKNGNTKNAVRSGSFNKSACEKYPNLYFGDMAFWTYDSTTPVTLKIVTCDVSSNFFESTIIIE